MHIQSGPSGFATGLRQRGDDNWTTATDNRSSEESAIGFDAIAITADGQLHATVVLVDLGRLAVHMAILGGAYNPNHAHSDCGISTDGKKDMQIETCTHLMLLMLCQPVKITDATLMHYAAGEGDKDGVELLFARTKLNRRVSCSCTFETSSDYLSTWTRS